MSFAIDAAKLFTVPGLVAVITGGGTGIGLMMAKALAHNGAAKVYVLGRRPEKLHEAARQTPHGNIIPIVCDVTSKESLAAAAAQVQREAGFVNLLVCNSGVTGPLLNKLAPNPTLKQFRDYAWSWDMNDFTHTYHVNDTAVFFTAVAFLELLDAGNTAANLPGVQSQVVVVGSIASYLRAVLTGFAYVSTKAGAVNLAKAMATYFVPFGIRVNALAPGLFPSDMTQGVLSRNNAGGSSELRFDKAFIPAERAGTDEDMAGSILYIASRAGAYLNGNVIVVDGGRLSMLPATY